MDKARLMAALTQEEGYRATLYDDRTGKPILPGDVLHGNPTLAIGWNVAARPCPPDLAQIILGYFVDQTWDQIQKDMPWASFLPECVQEALTDMSFNLGEAGLEGFDGFLGYLKAGKYAAAANDLESTLWWKEVGTRGPSIAERIRQAA